MQFVGKSHVDLIARVWVVFSCQLVALPVFGGVCTRTHTRVRVCTSAYTHSPGIGTLWKLTSLIFPLSPNLTWIFWHTLGPRACVLHLEGSRTEHCLA